MAFLYGFFCGLSLIIVIGAQNIFVIKQNILGQHGALVAFVCILCDIIMIAISTTFMQQIMHIMPTLKPIMLGFAILFLTYYGAKSLFTAKKVGANELALKDIHSSTKTRIQLIMLALLFSFLNPQAILDIIIIIGGLAGKYHHQFKLYFTLGVMIASITWFSSIAVVSQKFSNAFAHKRVWQGLEIVSGLLMITIAIQSGFMLSHSFM